MQRNGGKGLECLFACMPPTLLYEIGRVRESYADFDSRLSELRLRAGHYAALTLDGHNRLLPLSLSAAELSTIFEKLCDNSVYAHAETLKMGYISAFGFRVGVAGRAVMQGAEILTVTDIQALSIRIPHRVVGAGTEAVRAFLSMGGRRGLLVYSPPGVGKTTLLRELAYTLSCGEGARRLALIDTRSELYGEGAPLASQIDLLRDCPIALGITLATRTLSPEVIVCDEIGSEAEADAILAVAGGGVPIIASTHGGSLGEIGARPPMRRLLAAGIFGAAVGIAREGAQYTYETTYLEEGVPCFV